MPRLPAGGWAGDVIGLAAWFVSPFARSRTPPVATTRGGRHLFLKGETMSKRFKQFRIIVNTSTELAIEVNQLLSDGWDIWGQTMSLGCHDPNTGSQFAQTMVLPRNNDEETEETEETLDYPPLFPSRYRSTEMEDRKRSGDGTTIQPKGVPVDLGRRGQKTRKSKRGGDGKADKSPEDRARQLMGGKL